MVLKASNSSRFPFLFSLSSALSYDVDNEKIDNQEWVVCDKNDKDLSFEDGGDLGSGVVIDDDKVFDEMPERSEVENYVKTDEGNVVECDFGSLVQEDLGYVVDVGEMKVEEEDVICEDDDDDDWQGIETTELEKRFGAAVAFMGSKSSGERMDNDVKVELYGLQRYEDVIQTSVKHQDVKFLLAYITEIPEALVLLRGGDGDGEGVWRGKWGPLVAESREGGGWEDE
ncbi:hypothetical protein Tco_0679116, partial [Tanacetum coccineum]